MHLFFRFFSLAAAAVVIVDSLLAGGARFSAPLVLEESTVVSLYPLAYETTAEALNSVPLASDATVVDPPSAVARVDVTVEPADSSDFVLTKSHAIVEAVTPTPRNNDETGVEIPDSQNPNTTGNHVAYVNVPYVELADSAAVVGTVPPANLTVAFIGDQGPSSDALAVLGLIQSEGANMVLHQGDLDYEDNPTAWDRRINDVLGPDFPYFASIGNHDTGAWTGYQEKLIDRLARIPAATCTGDLGVRSSCGYQGLFLSFLGLA